MQFILTIINYYLMISHFSLLCVYCAESSDISCINDSLKDPIVENQTSETTSKFEADESKIENEDVKNLLDGSDRALIFFSESLTTKSKNVKVFFNQIEMKICDYLLKLDSILNSLIPKIFEDCEKINSLNEEIRTKIEEIKEKHKPFEMLTLPKVENFPKRKSEFYSNYNLTIIDLRTKVEALKLSFETFRNKLNELIPQITPSVLDFIAEYCCDLFIIKHENELSFLIIYLTNAKLTLKNDLKQAESVLFILSRLLTMTPEDFKADEEVERVIASLD